MFTKPHELSWLLISKNLNKDRYKWWYITLINTIHDRAFMLCSSASLWFMTERDSDTPTVCFGDLVFVPVGLTRVSGAYSDLLELLEIT